MRVFLAEMAEGDDPNDRGTEILGVFSTEEKAWAVASKHENGRLTGSVTAYELDGESSAQAVRWFDHRGIEQRRDEQLSR